MNCSRIFYKQIIRHTKNFKQNIRYASPQAAAATPNESASPKNILPPPTPDNQEKPISPKLESIVESISQLNLLEVADLAQLLKKRLNIPDAPVMPMGGFVNAAPAVEEEEAPPPAIKTSFTIKLTNFDANKKIKVIQELRTLFGDMNYLQANNFLKTAPAILKEGITKEEAETIKATFEQTGGTCEIS